LNNKKNNKEMISFKKINMLFISFLVGGAVGSSIALLYAPKQGKHLRNDISRKTNELIEFGKKKTFDSLHAAEEIADSTLDSANDFLNRGREKIARKTEKVKDAFKSGFNAYNNESDAENNRNSSFMENMENLYIQIK
jgi:gas vesicle protein